MPQLDLSLYPSQIFWLLVSFSLLFLAMSYWIVPFLGTSLSSRAAYLEETLEKSRSLQAQASLLHDKIYAQWTILRQEQHGERQWLTQEFTRRRTQVLQEIEAQHHRAFAQSPLKMDNPLLGMAQEEMASLLTPLLDEVWTKLLSSPSPSFSKERSLS